MVNVAKAVEYLIMKKPFLQDALARGLINNAALAESLIPHLTKELGTNVKFSAVNMAIRRLSEKLDYSTNSQGIHFDTNVDVSMRSDLIEITLFKLMGVKEYLEKINQLVDINQGDFLTITNGVHEIMVLTNAKYYSKITQILPKSVIKNALTNLGSITLNIPSNSVNTSGLFYMFTRALNWEAINIVDIVSTFTELTFIVAEDDLPRSFTSIKKTLQAHSN
jgi:aspartokinase